MDRDLAEEESTYKLELFRALLSRLRDVVLDGRSNSTFTRLSTTLMQKKRTLTLVLRFTQVTTIVTYVKQHGGVGIHKMVARFDFSTHGALYRLNIRKMVRTGLYLSTVHRGSMVWQGISTTKVKMILGCMPKQ